MKSDAIDINSHGVSNYTLVTKGGRQKRQQNINKEIAKKIVEGSPNPLFICIDGSKSNVY